MIIITILLSLLGTISGILAILALVSASGSSYRKTDEEKAQLKHGAKILGIASVAVLTLAYLSTSLVMVGVGQVGVVTRFGAVTGREIHPGVSTKLPAMIEDVVIFDTRVQKDEVSATAASQDLQDVNSTLAVNYHLEPGQVSSIYQSVGTDFNGKVLAPAIQESFKSTTAKFTAENLIKQRSEVAQAARTSLSERVKQYGISIDSVNIVNFSFSKDFSAAIEAAQVASQKVTEAENNLRRIQVEANQKIEQARGEAEAQRQQALTITPEYLELKRIEKWNGAYPTTIAGDNTLFSLPIAK